MQRSDMIEPKKNYGIYEALLLLYTCMWFWTAVISGLQGGFWIAVFASVFAVICYRYYKESRVERIAYQEWKKANKASPQWKEDDTWPQ